VIIQLKFKRKSSNLFKDTLLLITSIAIISFMGVGYAVWTNNVEIITSISTAKINPIFCSNYNLDEKHGSSNLVIKPEDDSHTFRITGDITMQGNNGNDKNNPGYKGFLHYCTKNDGTVPIKFIGDNGTIQVKINGSDKTLPVKIKDNKDNNSLEYEVEILADDGKGKLKITLNQQKGILYGGDSFYSETGNPKLQMETTEPGDYNFAIELPFILWNSSTMESNSWRTVLTIEGNITVEELVKDSNNMDNVIVEELVKDSNDMDNITVKESAEDPNNK
jgi:hypothetical protein